MKLYLGEVTYGNEKMPKRVLEEYASLVLTKLRKLLFEDNIRTEHGFGKSIEEYKVIFDDGHIARFANYEIQDFYEKVNKQKKKSNKKEKPTIDVNMLNKENKYDNELTM